MENGKTGIKKGEAASRIKSISPEERDKILRYLTTHDYTYHQDPELAILLDAKAGSRGIIDKLKLLEEKGDLFQWKEGRSLRYKLKDRELILEQLLKKDQVEEISQALDYLAAGESENFMEDFRRVFASNRDIVSGHLNIIESLGDDKISHYFKQLKKAVEERKYLKIRTKQPYNERFDNVKPIRLLFLDNNWYIFIEYQNAGEDSTARLVRLSFISEIETLADNKYSDKNTFQKKELEKYDEFLDNIQNANSRYGLPEKKAVIRANPPISHYFDEGMKKFLSSQRFIAKNEDGSVDFEVTYTTDLEVLRLVQMWLPDLVILEPKELRESYRHKLEQSLKEIETLY